MEQLLHASAQFSVCEVDLIYKRSYNLNDRPMIASSRDAYQVFLGSWDGQKIALIEQFKVIYLSQSSRVLGLYEMSSGGIAGTTVDIRLVFAAALKLSATRIILAHNHPSGSLKASEADLSVTRRLVEAGRLLDIQVTDHLILTPELYYSFGDDGLL